MGTTMELIRARHSVRRYTACPIEGATLQQLEQAVSDVARESGLDIQLVRDNPEAFDVVARFGVIKGARYHLAFVVPADAGTTLDESIGYEGQRLVLEAQHLGLNTCWAALFSRKKSKAERAAGEKVRIVIALGYGETAGNPRKTKPAAELGSFEGVGNPPAWFGAAMEAAQLAPTAMNHQRFHLTLRADGETVAASAPAGGYNLIDLGIVRRNFEEAANGEGAVWHWER